MTNWIIIPIEIRDGVTAQVQIPRDLKPEEAKKIARVIEAYGGADERLQQ